MTTATTWRCRCRRCKEAFPDWVDADWHNVATGHNYFEIARGGGLPPQLVDWRTQMRCDHNPTTT